MVSINLTTGVPFDGLCTALKKGIEDRKGDFSVVISLLNPHVPELMSALAPVFDIESDVLSGGIKNSLSKLYELKQSLSPCVREMFTLKVHNSLPFGSAIILDGLSGHGRIQIETKSYKAPIRKSFAFEVTDKGDNEIFHTLRESYSRLIEDGTNYESIMT